MTTVKACAAVTFLYLSTSTGQATSRSTDVKIFLRETWWYLQICQSKFAKAQQHL